MMSIESLLEDVDTKHFTIKEFKTKCNMLNVKHIDCMYEINNTFLIDDLDDDIICEYIRDNDNIFRVHPIIKYKACTIPSISYNTTLHDIIQTSPDILLNECSTHALLGTISKDLVNYKQLSNIVSSSHVHFWTTFGLFHPSNELVSNAITNKAWHILSNVPSSIINSTLKIKVMAIGSYDLMLLYNCPYINDEGRNIVYKEWLRVPLKASDILYELARYNDKPDKHVIDCIITQYKKNVYQNST